MVSLITYLRVAEIIVTVTRFWIRDTQEIRNVLKSLKFTPLISHNKRNTKDAEKRLYTGYFFENAQYIFFLKS